MAAFTMAHPNCDDNVSGSPILGRAAIERLVSHEEQGVPLRTHWTFWVDK